MFGKPKGYIGILPKITHSREPGMGPPGMGLMEPYDLTKDYFEALQGKTVPIMDIAVDGSSYLVLGNGEKSGQFIWDIDKEDTTQLVIPYNFVHPGPDIEDVIETLKILKKGVESVPCENFLNQTAIDAVLRKHNEELGEQLYTEGHNACFECRGQTIMGAHRICFKQRAQ